jgi:hypothetical protein
MLNTERFVDGKRLNYITSIITQKYKLNLMLSHKFSHNFR